MQCFSAAWLSGSCRCPIAVMGVVGHLDLTVLIFILCFCLSACSSLPAMLHWSIAYVVHKRNGEIYSVCRLGQRIDTNCRQINPSLSNDYRVKDAGSSRHTTVMPEGGKIASWFSIFSTFWTFKILGQACRPWVCHGTPRFWKIS